MDKEKISRIIRILGGVVVLFAMLFGWLLWFFLSNSKQEQPIQTVSVTPTPEASLTMSEDLAPDRSKLYRSYDAQLTDMEGNSVTLSTLFGQPTVLFFWSSWCGDCKSYFNLGLKEAKEAAESEGARFLLVCREGNRGETAESAKASLTEHGMEGEAFMDPQAALFVQLGLRSVPSFAFFTSDGRLLVTTDVLLSAEEMRGYVQYADGQMLSQTALFIQNYLMEEDGGVAASYTPDGVGQPIKSDIRLAESQGLMMEYALDVSDQALFQRAYAYVNSAMTQNGLCAWRSQNGQNESMNASLDDLRILQALLLAEKRWGGYKQDIAIREEALWQGVVREGYMLDYVGLAGENLAQTSTLCYLDVTALDALAQYHARWQPVADRARELLELGTISQAFPLYYPRYDVAQQCYSGSQLQMNEAMVCILHCARAGIAQDKTLDYLEQLLESGPVYAAYGLDGKPLEGYRFESTATYALLVQIGLETQREKIFRPALERMERSRCFIGFMKGGYGLTRETTHYIFDDLQALKAWSMIELNKSDNNK
ncbi:MAG: glycosyl hydrolase family 8 [Eubacteriales bacterium]|nr:glycosyl hydrolase family 8 [Eubacteriales bacterium]